MFNVALEKQIAIIFSDENIFTSMNILRSQQIQNCWIENEEKKESKLYTV